MNVIQSLQRFLNKYGFRCINEQKLEENSLHDDPGFVVDMVAGYVRTHSYSIAGMEERESEIAARPSRESTTAFPCTSECSSTGCCSMPGRRYGIART
jgi:hypothetical protein